MKFLEKGLIMIITENMLQIAQLPLHPKKKLKLCNRNLLAKTSWYVAVADISAAFIKKNFTASVISRESICIWLYILVRLSAVVRRFTL